MMHGGLGFGIGARALMMESGEAVNEQSLIVIHPH
jgi:hypothetical protein